MCLGLVKNLLDCSEVKFVSLSVAARTRHPRVKRDMLKPLRFTTKTSQVPRLADIALCCTKDQGTKATE